MGFALRKQDAARGPAATASLKKRLYAWWNGYELRPSAADAGGSDRGEDATGADEPADGTSPWNENRRQLAQELWTPGFVLPGSNAYVEKLVSGCNLTAAETMLELGVGMGGDTRTIIAKFGNYVTGYERDAELAAAARRHAVSYDMDDKFDVVNAPFETVDLKAGYFRAALLRDVLFTVEDKAGLLGKVVGSLKTGESFVIATDFLFDAADASPELEAWKAVEEHPVYPWTRDELLACLKSAQITPRIVEDESDEYRRMVIDAWADYLKSIEGREISEDMGRELEREGEFWARRVAALESGALKYYHVEGVKVS